MPIIKLFESKARLDKGVVTTDAGQFTLDRINPQMILSMLAGCIAKTVKDKADAKRVTVSIETYTDIDKILEGQEEIEFIDIIVESDADEKMVKESIERCPLIGLIDKGKIRRVIVRQAL